MVKSSTLSGTISDLAFGGKGILRSEEGKVFFVPFTIPGEEIVCEITKEKKDYGEAVCKKILKPSRDRVSPLCPYFGVCGGCQLQHVRYDAQSNLKKHMVEEALRRVYPNAEVTFKPSLTPWAYRRKIHLTLKPGNQGFKTGYIALDNRSLIEVKECPIFVAQDDRIIKLCAEIASNLEAEPGNSGKALLLKTVTGDFVLHFHFKRMPSNADEVLKNAYKKPFHAIHCSTPRKKLTFGEQDLTLEQGSLTLRYNSEAFLQNHPEMSSELYSFIERTISKAKPSLLIDLYAGIGITSLLAAPHCKSLESVEFNAEAVRLSRLNSKENRIRYTAHQGMVEELLPKLLQKKPQAALCNPPREGMNQDACMLMAQSSIHTLLYTSCHPATLARDLRHFKAKGYNLIEALAFDMFPQTGHVETVVHLERS